MTGAKGVARRVGYPLMHSTPPVVAVQSLARPGSCRHTTNCIWEPHNRAHALVFEKGAVNIDPRCPYTPVALCLTYPDISTGVVRCVITAGWSGLHISIKGVWGSGSGQ